MLLSVLVCPTALHVFARRLQCAEKWTRSVHLTCAGTLSKPCTHALLTRSCPFTGILVNVAMAKGNSWPYALNKHASGCHALIYFLPCAAARGVGPLTRTSILRPLRSRRLLAAQLSFFVFLRPARFGHVVHWLATWPAHRFVYCSVCAAAVQQTVHRSALRRALLCSTDAGSNRPTLPGAVQDALPESNALHGDGEEPRCRAAWQTCIERLL